MTTLERCIESLAFCHVQDEPRWAVARVVAQQDIDEYLREAGPDSADKRRALEQLMSEFNGRCPGELDPVLIRSYMRRQLRRLGYDLQRAEEGGGTETVAEEIALATAPAEGEHQAEVAGQQAMIGQRPSDTAPLETNLTSRTD